jgi:hypothetical protein
MLLNLSRVMAHCTTVQNFTAHQITHSRMVVMLITRVHMHKRMQAKATLVIH